MTRPVAASWRGSGEDLLMPLLHNPQLPVQVQQRLALAGVTRTRDLLGSV